MSCERAICESKSMVSGLGRLVLLSHISTVGVFCYSMAVFYYLVGRRCFLTQCCMKKLVVVVRWYEGRGGATAVPCSIHVMYVRSDWSASGWSTNVLSVSGVDSTVSVTLNIIDR